MHVLAINPGHFCFHSSIEPAVPPEAALLLEAELLEVTEAPDLELLAPPLKAALACQKRERGNAHFQRGDYAFAVNSYSIALQITESSSKGWVTRRGQRGGCMEC